MRALPVVFRARWEAGIPLVIKTGQEISGFTEGSYSPHTTAERSETHPRKTP
jgi:hypothetical protein